MPILANRHKFWRRAALGFLAFVLTSLPTGTASAADPVKGQRLAEQWCVSCHFVDGRPTAPDTGPPFGQLANDNAYTEARIRAWLHDPRPPMPKLGLSRQTIDDIIAFIATLKDK